jgi:hypothetical protein
MKNKSVGRVVLSKIFGFVFFLFMIFLLNFLASYIDNPVYLSMVSFINRNIVLLIVMSLIFMIAGIFDAIIFPFNLPAPIFNAIGAILIIIFMQRMFYLVDDITGEKVSVVFTILSYLLYPLVFLIVLIGGYISIFVRLFTPEHVRNPEHAKEKVINVKRVKTWEDVGNEFRQLLYDFLSMIRSSFKKK